MYNVIGKYAYKSHRYTWEKVNVQVNTVKMVQTSKIQYKMINEHVKKIQKEYSGNYTKRQNKFKIVNIKNRFEFNNSK